MKTKTLILLAFFLVSYLNVFSDETTDKFTKANSLYRAGDYKAAAELYERIIATGYSSKELYYNLGNSYFKLKMIPNSILNYERAHRIDPNDEDININLQIANMQIVDKIEPIPRIFFEEWFDDFLEAIPSDTFAYVSFISLWLGLGFALLYIFAYHISLKKGAFGAGAILLLVFLITLFLSHIDINRELSEKDAIIFSPSVYIKSSPDVQATDLFILHEGTKVRKLDEVDEWVKIKIPDGKVGWMPIKAAITI